MTHPEDPRDFIEPIKGLRMNRRDFTTWLGSAALPGRSGCGALSSVRRGRRPRTYNHYCGTDNYCATPQPRLRQRPPRLSPEKGSRSSGLYRPWRLSSTTSGTRARVKLQRLSGLEWQLQVDEFDVQTAESIIDSAVGVGTRMFVTSSLSTANEPVIASATGAAGAYLINNYNIPDFYTPFDSGFTAHRLARTRRDLGR